MENLFKVIIMAVLQGIAEFLPISSSGHLVLAKHYLGVETDHSATLEIVLHGGTLLSILVFYFKHLVNIARGVLRKEKEAIRFALLILVGCIPAVVVVFTAGDFLEQNFASPRAASFALCGTGFFLTFVHFFHAGTHAVTFPRAIIIGIAQAVALMPGVSRSGSTIGTSRLLGVCPKQAAEYSFLMSTPLLVGACLLALKDLVGGEGVGGDVSGLSLVVGFVVAAVVGYFSLKWLVKLLQKGKFWRFGIYCLCAGVTSLVMLALGY